VFLKRKKKCGGRKSAKRQEGTRQSAPKEEVGRPARIDPVWNNEVGAVRTGKKKAKMEDEVAREHSDKYTIQQCVRSTGEK